MEPFEQAKEIAAILDSKKGRGIKVLRVRDLTVLADYFVIASGTSSTQVGALAEEVEFRLAQAGTEPLRVEGKKAGGWILLDYGAVVVHVFYPEARDFYALERLWADAEPVALPFADAEEG